MAQIDQQWWVNKVGTYGVASAQLYWGRMAALLLRILYAMFPEVDWGFVFVDDFCWILRSNNASWLTPAVLGVLLALGTPLSWKKTVLSEIKGNVYSILNNATRRMPTAVILMELVYQLYQAGHMLAPSHSRRDDNQWADELTHPDPKGFDPALKVDLTPIFQRFVLIPKILESGEHALWTDTDAHL